MSAQRELKFRWWSLIGGEGHMTYSDRVASYTHSDLKTIPGQWYVMQFTGLKDKNGKEIYEGDIVRWDEVNSEVYYEGSGFYFQPFAWPHTPLSLSMADDGDIEVIGNIHEHPHLIAEEAGAQAREGSKASTPQRDSARSTAVEPDPRNEGHAQPTEVKHPSSVKGIVEEIIDELRAAYFEWGKDYDITFGPNAKLGSPGLDARLHARLTALLSPDKA